MSRAVMSAGSPWSEVAVARWSDIADKIVTLAEEFPAEKYEDRPASGIRSFAEQLRHVAFWNGYVQKTLCRVEADGDANELPRETYPTKSKIVGVLRDSFDSVKAELANGSVREASDLNTVISFVEHNGEHYGQLVIYCRLNGIVPPASR